MRSSGGGERVEECGLDLSMKHLDHSVRISVIMNWRVVSGRPDLKDVRNSWRVSLLQSISHCIETWEYVLPSCSLR